MKSSKFLKLWQDIIAGKIQPEQWINDYSNYIWSCFDDLSPKQIKPGDTGDTTNIIKIGETG